MHQHQPRCPAIHRDGTPCGQPLGHYGRHGNGTLHKGQSWGDAENRPPEPVEVVTDLFGDVAEPDATGRP